MFQSFRTVPCLALIGAMALTVPALARDLVIVDGPVRAKNVRCNGCVNARDIGNNAVGSGELRNNAVTRQKIADDAVGTEQIRNGAVTSDKIADGAVTPEKLGFTVSVEDDIAPFRVVEQKPNFDCTGEVFIEIDNTGSDEFVVTSILVETSGLAEQDFAVFSLEGVRIKHFINNEPSNFRFDTPSVIASVGGQQFSEFEAADLMGAPLTDGGTFPHQIVASALGSGPDVRVIVDCNIDSSAPFLITAVAVSGWKQPEDAVTLDYFLE